MFKNNIIKYRVSILKIKKNKLSDFKNIIIKLERLLCLWID